jgi:hypothetical protein
VSSNLLPRTSSPYSSFLLYRSHICTSGRLTRSALLGFDWAALPANARVVDIGGGIGSHTIRLAHAFPHLRFVVQDRAPVCAMGANAWHSQCSTAADEGRVVFQGERASLFFSGAQVADAQTGCAQGTTSSMRSRSATRTCSC